MRIGIIGGGTVGKAMARVLVERVEIRLYDRMKDRSTHSLKGTLDSDLIFICLPSPQSSSGMEADLTDIHNFFASLKGDELERNYVLKSTVPIGTTRKLKAMYGLNNIVHSPEFLTARCAAVDAHLPTRNIIGEVPELYSLEETGVNGQPDIGSRSEVCFQLYQLYKGRFPGVPIHVMTSDESEAVKLFTNGFFAVKISYFNEINALCNRLDLDWHRVLNGVLSDGRIAHSHTRVPGPSGHAGFGGACVPGDTLVKTVNGDIPIKNLSGMQELSFVVSCNSSCSTEEHKRILQVTSREYAGDLIVLEFQDGKEFRCTPDHLIPVLRSGQMVLVKAAQIETSDKLFINS